jgi:N-acetylglucosamine kinase-like BadF-type ATPase
VSAAGDGWVLGVDSGGSGLRVALTRAGAPDVNHLAGTVHLECPEPVRTGPEGIDAEHLTAQVVPAVRNLLERVVATAPAAACVGAAGMATLGDDLRARLPGEFARELGVRELTLAADAVTAYAGALGVTPGAVVAAGTGMIAMGTDLTSWRRVDGWGHLLGDCGGGAWIGRAGLEAALRAHDGRPGGSAALLLRAEEVFGPAPGLPGLLYPRTDRPAVLASFAPHVADCARTSADGPGDTTARAVIEAAAREIARSAAAACPEPAGEASGPRVALTGGLFRMGEVLLDPLHRELAALLPRARTVAAAGDPLDGALLLASRQATASAGLPQEAGLLTVHFRDGTD